MDIKTGTLGTGKGATLVILGFSDRKPEFIAETTHSDHDEHHKHHAAEMCLNIKQWKQAAADLLNDEPRLYYQDWENPEDDSFNRFDTKHGLLVVGDRTGTINTYFKLEKSKYKYYIPVEYLEKTDTKK
ncbi:MAG: hypothetical protein SPL45_00590 [Schwartzia succinivorans]|nr:hypothetical protein [Schwartzia succinivorans]